MSPQFLCSSQVFPGAWTAVYVSLDNVGIWNVRAENLDTWYLGQEAYMKIVNPERTNKTELPVPDNVLYCGLLQYLQKYVIPFFKVSPAVMYSLASNTRFTF